MSQQWVRVERWEIRKCAPRGQNQGMAEGTALASTSMVPTRRRDTGTVITLSRCQAELPWRPSRVVCASRRPMLCPNTARELDSFPENSKVRYSGQLGEKKETPPPFSSFKILGSVNTADESFICLNLADSVSIHNPLDL